MSGIYRIECNNDNKTGYYIGLTKRGIKEKKCKFDISNSRENTVIAKISPKENIYINYNKIKRLANFNNRNYAFYREAIEIISNNKTCNTMEYFSVDQE